MIKSAQNFQGLGPIAVALASPYCYWHCWILAIIVQSARTKICFSDS